MLTVKSDKKKNRRSELKKDKYRKELAEQTGIYFSSELEAGETKYLPFLKYIVNSLALFGATFGSLYCLITTFELDITIIPLLITCIVASLVLSFMYISYKLKILTYLVVLAMSITAIFRYYSVINSGISSIRNNCLKYIDDKVDLPFLREFNLIFDDEYTAMSITVCVLAVAIMIILNIFISEKMSLAMLFLITFPIVQFGMYFNFDSSRIALICVISSWFLVAGTKFTNSYNGLSNKMESNSSIKKHCHKYGFSTDSQNVAKISIIWLLFIFAVSGLVFSTVSSDNFKIALPTDVIKQSTMRVTKNFLSYGFSSAYTRNSKATEPGELANLSSIVYDGKTDLKVTLVDFNEERMYLRSFVGYNYNSNSLKWETNEPGPQCEQQIDISAKLLKNDFEHSKCNALSMHKIGIRIVDSTLVLQPLNIPYYSIINNKENYMFRSSGEFKSADISTADETKYYTFYTIDDYNSLSNISVLPNNVDINNIHILDDSRKDAYENALYVPDRNKEAIKKFCDNYDIVPGDDAVSKVVTALETDYSYTLKPGKIPYGEDYINYFLLANQQGYCQHFASAATLIFRYLGIPARYAEGYVVDTSDFIYAKKLLDEDVSEWITADYETSKYVYEVDVPDHSGHAWVEIFVDGFGWMPIEATAAADEQPARRGLLATLFGRRDVLTNTTDNIVGSIKKIDEQKTKKQISNLMSLSIILLVFIYFTRMIISIAKRHKGFHTDNRRKNISNRYNHLYSTYKYSNEIGYEMSYKELFDTIIKENTFSEKQLNINERFEKALFSNEEINNEEYNILCYDLKMFKTAIMSRMRISKKIKYYIIDFKM